MDAKPGHQTSNMHQ